MTAEQAKCGTISGYNRHRNAEEAPCVACRKAKSSDKANRREAERAEAAEQAREIYEGIVLEPESDRITLLKEQRDILRAHSQAAPPQSIAAISRQLSAVLAEIEDLEAEKKAGESKSQGPAAPASGPVHSSGGGSVANIFERHEARERQRRSG